MRETDIQTPRIIQNDSEIQRQASNQKTYIPGEMQRQTDRDRDRHLRRNIHTHTA